MLVLQTDVLGGNKLNCFKSMQLLGGPTYILIWGSEIAKIPTRYIKGDLELWYQGGPKSLWGGGLWTPMMPWQMYVVSTVDHHEDQDWMSKLNYRGELVLLFDCQVFVQRFPLQLSKHVWMAHLFAVAS